jgi:polysaccharide export outer membrane protein
VVVTGMNSRRIFVTGEVTHTGPLPLLPHMTMLQALAQAGFTQFANPKGIYLLRTENGKQEKTPFNYKEVVKGRHPEQNIELRPGDTIVVP